jgi:hypothetical protein
VALQCGKRKVDFESSRIGQSSGVEVEGLNPWVSNSECSEFGRLFNSGFETGFK